MSIFKKHVSLLIILVIAFALRASLLIVAFQHPERAFQLDSLTYVEPALKLLGEGLYPETAYRTPVYPLFIAAIYSVFGPHPQAVIAGQVIIGMFSVLLTYILGLRLVCRRTAIIAALLMAINVESITHTFYILSETLFTFLLLLSLLALIQFWQKGGRFLLPISAITMAVATLCRPITQYLPVLVAILIVFGLRQLAWRQRFFAAATYLIVFIVTLGPWIARNYYLCGIPAVSTIESYSMLGYNAATVEAYLSRGSEEAARRKLQDQVNAQMAASGLADNDINRSRVQNQLAHQIIFGYPAIFLYMHLKGDLNSLLPDATGTMEILGLTVGGKGTLSVLNQQGVVAAVEHYFGGSMWLLWLFSPLILLLVLNYFFFLVGAVVLASKKEWFVFWVLLIPIMYLLLLPGAASMARFRVPVMPYLCVIAGFGIQVAGQYAKCILGRKPMR